MDVLVGAFFPPFEQADCYERIDGALHRVSVVSGHSWGCLLADVPCFAAHYAVVV
jgi:hypothetical protein